MINIVLFLSGRGSNAINILAKQDRSYKVVGVLSNNSKSSALDMIKNNYPIDVAVFDKNHPQTGNNTERKKTEHPVPKPPQPKIDQENQILQWLTQLEKIDYICLCGYMQVLSRYFIEQCHQQNTQIINIHPSLLPEYKGLSTHQRVLNDGKKRHGCTVHYVSEKIDDGRIIQSKSLTIKQSYNAQQLAEAVLKLEHLLYPEVIKNLSEKSK